MAQTGKFLRVLHADDSSRDSDLIQDALRNIGHPFYFQRITNIGELKEALETGHWDVLISEHQIGIMTGIEALTVVKASGSDLPFVLVSKAIGEESVADMMKAGIDDYVCKLRLERLVPVVKKILKEQEIKESESRAHKLASKANAAKEQMLAIVSHDIKNPLSAIQMEAQMLLRSAAKNGKSLLADEVKVQACRILKTTDRLKTLISDILDKNKTENSLVSLEKSEVDMNKLLLEVQDSCRILYQKKGIHLNTSGPKKGPILSIDRNKMFQVFTNLLTNAIKFTPQGGGIVINLVDNGDDLIFTISDTGPGLDSEDLPRAFDNYWTGKLSDNAGTGLGLFICKTIIEAHGGTIRVQNLLHGGALFTVGLPRTSAERRPYTYYDSNREDGRKIMIIDDDEDLREVMAWALGKEGYSVQSFKDPMEAVEFLKEGRKIPHLILADYHMHGMRGEDFLQLKSSIPSSSVKNCPVVMISASPLEVQSQVPRELYKDIITKPLDIEGLLENMKIYLN